MGEVHLINEVVRYSTRMLMVGVATTTGKRDEIMFVVVGLILVHDLTNRKSHSHLSKWLNEFHQSQSRSGRPFNSDSPVRSGTPTISH